MEDRDEQILDHIGRYQVSIRAVIERLFFNGADGDHVLRRLKEQQRIAEIAGALPGNLKGYYLTLKEARSKGMEYRGRFKPSSSTLRPHLTALWFSCMTPHHRKRLTEREVKTVLDLDDDERSIAIHVAHLDGDQSTIYRLHLPEEGTDPAAFCRKLERLSCAIDTGRDEKLMKLRAWAKRGTYQYAVIVDHQLRKEDLERRLRQDGRDIPIGLVIEVVPSLEQLAETIRTLPKVKPNV